MPVAGSQNLTPPDFHTDPDSYLPPPAPSFFQDPTPLPGFSKAIDPKERAKQSEQIVQLQEKMQGLQNDQAKGGIDVLKRLFEPLGYQIDAAALPLDEKFRNGETAATLT